MTSQTMKDGKAGVRRGFRRIAVMAGAITMLSGCSMDGILGSDELPPEVTDPAITKSPEGAIAAYYGVIEVFRRAFGGEFNGPQTSAIAIGGLLSDELQLGSGNLGFSSAPVDARIMPEGMTDGWSLAAYSKLQRVRGQASQAIGLLNAYVPDEPALAGHAYIFQGYAEIMLAELFCSGIPLSTLDYEGDYTLRPGSTTDEVYRHALALVDTALILAADSARIVHLGHMARARALLSLGRLADAAAAAASVPDAFEYPVTFVAGASSSSRNFALVFASTWPLSVSDGEGLNGLSYRSSQDPRAASSQVETNGSGWEVFHPDKYARDGSSSIMLASGVEARLIGGEAALAAGDASWLTTLNALRTNGSFTTRPNATDPERVDTLWNAGSGRVARLAPLEDPGTAETRLDLLFRERAFWLFLTGHRQADLRRLIRHYGRTQSEVYPVGAYPSLNAESYGFDVTIPVPVAESVSNPHFTGCISRGA